MYFGHYDLVTIGSGVVVVGRMYVCERGDPQDVGVDLPVGKIWNVRFSDGGSGRSDGILRCMRPRL